MVDYLAKKNRKSERAMGIEPTSEAWEASILPLNYARDFPTERMSKLGPILDEASDVGRLVSLARLNEQ